MGRTAPPGDWAVPSPSANRALFGVAIGLALLATASYVLSPGFALGPFPMRRLLEVTPVFSRFPAPVQAVWLDLTRHPRVAASLYAGILVAMSVLHAVARRLASRAGAPMKRWVVLGFAVAAGASVTMVPAHSQDIFSYLGFAQIQKDLRLSPYETGPASHLELSACQYCVAPVHHGSIYGSVATRLFTLLYIPALGVGGFLLLWRVLMAALLGLTLLALARTGGTMRHDAARRRAELVMFAWCPLVFVAGITHGHVDVLVGFLLALGCLQVARERELLGLILLASTVCVKASFAVLLPAILMRAYLSGASPRRGIARALAVLAAAAALFALALLPHDLTWRSFDPLRQVQGWTRNSLPDVVRLALRSYGWGKSVLIPFRIGLAVFLLVGLRSVATREGFFRRLARDYVVYLLVFSQFFYAWYLLAALVLSALADDTVLQDVVLLAAATSLVAINATEILHAQGFWLRIALYVAGPLPGTILLLARRFPRRATLAGPGVA